MRLRPVQFAVIHVRMEAHICQTGRGRDPEILAIYNTRRPNPINEGEITHQSSSRLAARCKGEIVRGYFEVKAPDKAVINSTWQNYPSGYCIRLGFAVPSLTILTDSLHMQEHSILKIKQVRSDSNLKLYINFTFSSGT
jgi:hypothetical protein